MWGKRQNREEKETRGKEMCNRKCPSQSWLKQIQGTNFPIFVICRLSSKVSVPVFVQMMPSESFAQRKANSGLPKIPEKRQS
jgi:hypothetical protein